MYSLFLVDSTQDGIPYKFGRKGSYIVYILYHMVHMYLCNFHLDDQSIDKHRQTNNHHYIYI